MLLLFYCLIKILREVSSSDMVLTQVSMSRSGRMLFVATKTGTVRAMKFPLTVPGEWQEYQSHCGTVTKVLFIKIPTSKTLLYMNKSLFILFLDAYIL